MLDYPQYVPRPEGARGPDPLGMQSTIMGLYRKVLPGLNNRARYTRVYSAICWMVSQIWDTLDDDASDEAIQAAFDAGIPKIQLLLVWGNTRWNVRAIPGSSRKWPTDNDPGVLSYSAMPTRGSSAALDADDEEEESDDAGPDGTTFLGPDEYAPSITNGLQFLSRWQGYHQVFELTEAGEALAESFEKLLREHYPQKAQWLRDPSRNSIKASGVDALWEVLRLDKTTRDEREAFAQQLFPDTPTSALSPDFALRRDGIMLALRALAAEEQSTPGKYVDVGRIRHTMARGVGSDGKPLNLKGLETTQLVWKSLQIRKYLKVALETLFRSCEVRIHHAISRSFQTDASGRRHYINRDIESIARAVAEVGSKSLLGEKAGTVARLLDAIEERRKDAPDLYCAGLKDKDIDLASNLAYLVKKSKFRMTDERESDAVGSALFAVLWCAVQARYMPSACIVEDGDRLSLDVLQALVQRFLHDTPEDFLVALISEHVINLHFDVARERCEEDYSAGRTVKDRYRILMGDEGLERNQSRGHKLTRAIEMHDILLHALYLLSQTGFLAEHSTRAGHFKLSAAGTRRAEMDLEALDGPASVNENNLVPV
ncbi:hypothetical protein [Trinickia sp.]|uniref:hypothetical protein n=1 Tax=Trinickia sp. TaxID=2571163 RepID=UPI003F81D2DE